MLTAGLFAWALIFCGLLVSLLPFRFYRIEFAALTVILGFLLGTWLAFLLSLVLPYGFSLPITVGLLCVGSRVLYGLRSTSRCTWVPLVEEPFRNVHWIALTIITTVGLSYFFRTHMAWIRADGKMYSGGATWSDSGMHISLISYQSQQPRFDTVFPLLWHTRLVYHFLIDWLSSLFLRSGFSMAASLMVPGLSLALAFVQLTVYTSYRFFRHWGAAALTVYLFLLGGSTEGTFLCIQDLWYAKDGAWDLFRHLQPEYTTIWEKNAVFSNFTTCALLPERPVLFGFGGLAVLFNIIAQIEATPSRSAVLLAGLIVGLLPLAQIHAWMGCTAVVAALVVRELWLTRGLGRWAAALLISFLGAAPQLWYLLLKAYHPGYGFYHVGWIMDSDNSPLGFWVRNMGPALFFLVMNMDCCCHRWRGTPLPALYFPFIAMFIFCNLYSLQPSNYDDIKLLHMVYLAIALLAAPLSTEALSRGGWRRFAAGLAIVLWITPGALSLWREENVSDWVMAEKNDMLFARLIREKTDPSALFIVPPDQHQPVPFLGGRKVVLGWQGWLESYGLDVKEIEADEKRIVTGSPDAMALLAKYQPDYLLLDKSRLDDFKPNTDYFRDKLHLTYEDDHWALFRVSPAPTPTP